MEPGCVLERYGKDSAEGWGEVHETHGSGHDRARRQQAGRREDHRHVQAALIEEQPVGQLAVLAERLAMIACYRHNGCGRMP